MIRIDFEQLQWEVENITDLRGQNFRISTPMSYASTNITVNVLDVVGKYKLVYVYSPSKNLYETQVYSSPDNEYLAFCPYWLYCTPPNPKFPNPDFARKVIGIAEFLSTEDLLKTI
jgi:hypothetical protein